jgi:hypothetical protein
MARISGIVCPVITANMAGAGTDGRVYLGLGGREFRLDSSADDFEKHVYGGQFITAYTVPDDFHNLWLGHAAGKVVYLITEWRLGERALLDAARQLARKLGATPQRP